MKFKSINLTDFSFLYIFLIILNISFCAHHTKEEWKSRSIYQLLTDRFAQDNKDLKIECNLSNYCGGTFNGILQHIDYIKGMGFDAIWISPILKNKEGSFHGYHNIDIYSINEHFGTSNDLKELIKVCHENDIWVILDAVPNHMAGDVPIESLIPFNKNEYFHDDCGSIDDSDKTQEQKENCPIYGMPDLKQENEFVNKTLLSWIKDTIEEYDFDGVRYADVANIPKWFWKAFTQAANTYTLGIVSSSNASYISDYQNYMDGVGNYPLFYIIRESFCGGSMKKLEEYYLNTHRLYINPTFNANWIGNHDNIRFLNINNDQKQLKNAIIFNLFYEGIPIFYYGDEQYFNGGRDPLNRETLFGYHNTSSQIYQMIKIANEVRKNEKIYDEKFEQRYVDDNFYAFTRGKVLIVVSNNLKNSEIPISLDDFNEGDNLCNRLEENDCVKVNSFKEINVKIEGEPKIYVISDYKRDGNSKNMKYYSIYLILLFIFLLFIILL